jgi:hypothetical protein
MSSAGDQGRNRGDQGIEAWARHGVEEYDEREAMDRAERGLKASELSDFPVEAGTGASTEARTAANTEASSSVGSDETERDDIERDETEQDDSKQDNTGHDNTGHESSGHESSGQNDAQNYGSGAGSPVPSNRPADSAKTIES